MAFVLPKGLSLIKWTREFFSEYVRENAFDAYMGKGTKNVININYDLSKGAGAEVRFPYARKLKGAVTVDGQVLKGNEASMVVGNDAVKVRLQRFAVVFTEDQTYPTDLPLLEQAKDELAQKAQKDIELDVAAALTAVIVKGTDGAADTAVPLASASAGQITSFNTNNADRVITGATADAALVRRAKSMALRTQTGNSYAITPLKSSASAGRDNFVMFCGLDVFEAFQQDPEIRENYLKAAPRELDGTVFQGGDLWLDGVIIHLVPEMADDTAELCGQNAVVMAWGKETTMIKDDDDFGHRKAIGYKEIRGQKPASLDGVQVGKVSIRFA